LSVDEIIPLGASCIINRKSDDDVATWPFLNYFQTQAFFRLYFWQTNCLQNYYIRAYLFTGYRLSVLFQLASKVLHSYWLYI